MKKILKLVCALIILFFGFLLDYFDIVNYQNIPKETILKKEKLSEKDYVNLTCEGKIEYVLEDSTRIDCLTDEYAIEYDWAKKWAESVGQSLYYSKMTNKKPAVAIILNSDNDEKYIKRIEKIGLDIKIFKIYANNLEKQKSLL